MTANNMVHHIKETADGFISLLSVMGLFTISATTADWTMKVISFILGSAVSILAGIYYWKAIKSNKHK
jgi:hypothetical protein